MNLSLNVSEFFEKNGADFGLASFEANRIIGSKYSSNPPRGAKEIFDGQLKSGKIYIFDYVTSSEIGKDRNYINLMPIGIYSESKRTNTGEVIDFFIDLVVTPPKNRMEILLGISEKNEEIIRANQKDPSLPQANLDIRFSTIKGYLGKTGFQFSYTGFKKSGLRNLRIVEYQDWPILPYVTTNRLRGDSISEIYRKYRSKLNSGNVI